MKTENLRYFHTEEKQKKTNFRYFVNVKNTRNVTPSPPKRDMTLFRDKIDLCVTSVLEVIEVIEVLEVLEVIEVLDVLEVPEVLERKDA